MDPNLYHLGAIRQQEMLEDARAYYSWPAPRKRPWSFSVWFRSVRAQVSQAAARFRAAQVDDCIEATPSA